MQTGSDFIRAQVNNAIAQHHSLVESIEAHGKQADDGRYRELCRRHLPRLQHHQKLLEDYGSTVGAGAGGGVKQALGDVFSKARESVDALREDDFLRVVGDIVMIRQAQDTFATFAAVGETIGQARLADIGHECAADHNDMQREFNSLVHDLFIEKAGGRTDAAIVDRSRTEARL